MRASPLTPARQQRSPPRPCEEVRIWGTPGKLYDGIYQRDYRDCPNARKLMFETLMLPLYPRYPDAQIERNIEIIREHFGK